jgi:putative colanic acid biosynthesis UDP-glucose lipid carrier transferase
MGYWGRARALEVRAESKIPARHAFCFAGDVVPNRSLNERGIIRPYQTEVDIAARLADPVLICLALGISCLFSDESFGSAETLAAAVGSVLFLMFGEAGGVYRRVRGETVQQEVLRLFTTWLGVVAVLLLAGFLTKTTAVYSRLTMTGWVFAAPTLLFVWRIGLRIVLQELRARGFNSRTAAIVGVSAVGEQLAQRIAHSPWMGIQLVGFFDDRSIARLDARDLSQIEVRGGLDALVARARNGEIDLVYIALPPRAEPRINHLIRRLADTTASVYLAYDFGGYDLLRAKWSSVGDVPVMSVVEDPFYGLDGFVKRIEDILLGTLILSIIAIPMLAIAAAVKLTSRGPIFFRQRRYGLNGEEIRILKFRTMTSCDDGETVVQATQNDVRLTSLGGFLRRTSLDELPQFLQVISGTMSIVGPRPHAVAHNEQYRSLIQGYMRRHKVKPGITGWAQVHGWRGETDTVEKMQLRVQYDLDYINRWNLGLDLKIIFMTIGTVLSRRNAY